jgi:hypothetical protein
MADPISVLSKEYRRWPVALTVDGAVIDPTTDPVSLAFMATAETPETSDFVAATWETVAFTPPKYYARLLIGPSGDVVLAPGTYRVWLKVTDNPEVPVLPIDTLAVLGTFAVSGGTYSNDPANVPADQVRFLLGDTTAPFLLSDAEVAWLLTTADDVALTAAASGAGGLAARFAGLVDATTGDVSKSYSQKAKGYAELAKRLAAAAVTAASGEAVPVPWAGGISWSERDTNAADSDLTAPYFYEGMDSRPGTTSDRAGWW